MYANLDGMKLVPVYNNDLMKDLIFKVDVPEGVEVTLVSWSHVLQAQILEVE